MNSTLYQVFYFLSVIINLALGGFFIIPTLLLLSVHSRNFCKNMTTNERYSRKALVSQSQSRTSNLNEESESLLRQSEASASFLNFDQGNMFVNCLSMCRYTPPGQEEVLEEVSGNPI